MNQTYFEHSQEVKREIEQSSDLLDKIRDSFHGKGDRIAHTDCTEIWRIGKLESGLYIALRIDYSPFLFEMTKLSLENYCSNAERLFNEGNNVPDFCVGVTLDEDAGIITEDLTDNNRNTLTETGKGSEKARCLQTKPDGETKEIYVDIDSKWSADPKINRGNLRYFKEGNYIRLE
jgi:hypothetical protein